MIACVCGEIKNENVKIAVQHAISDNDVQSALLFLNKFRQSFGSTSGKNDKGNRKYTLSK